MGVNRGYRIDIGDMVIKLYPKDWALVKGATWDLNKTTVTKRKETEETSSSFYNQCSMYDPFVNVQRSPCSPWKPILLFVPFDLTAQI